jgi:hypothetical protein
MPRSIVTIPLFGLLALSTAAHAEPECFCLRHPQTGNMLYGCETRNQRYLCSDLHRPSVKAAPPIASDWKRVDCPPDYCQPKEPELRIEVPRYGEEVLDDEEEPQREGPRKQEPKPGR